jgi:hypothetical protein
MKADPSKLKTRINQNASIIELGLEGKLESALERLKQTLNLGYELQVKWVPNGDSKLSGEVKDECIYIYEEKEDEALKTLVHELLDYALSKTIEPYKQVTNKLITLINEEAYKRKEKLTESLSKFVINGLHSDG